MYEKEQLPENLYSNSVIELRAKIFDRRIAFVLMFVTAIVFFLCGSTYNVDDRFSITCYSMSSGIIGALATSTAKLFD